LRKIVRSFSNMTAPDAIRLDDADNVATAVRTLQPGDTVLGVTLSERVRGATSWLWPHCRRAAGGQVWPVYRPRLGSILRPAAHVHSHNLAFAATAADYEFSTNVKPVQDGARYSTGQL
jgi:altronate hydrolase